jgi:superoxide reductase
MRKLGDYFQEADWKKEKHVPVIECPDSVSAGNLFDIKVSIGKEIAHPNTTEHHIRWIQVFFQPDSGKFTYQVGDFQFTAHGESAEGPDKGPVYTNHSAVASVKITQPGTIHALVLCNIHGLWENSREIKIK